MSRVMIPPKVPDVDAKFPSPRPEGGLASLFMTMLGYLGFGADPSASSGLLGHILLPRVARSVEASAVEARARRAPSISVGSEIRFEHVNFRHRDVSHALHDMSFVIPAGQVVGFVDLPQSGRSVLANLMLRRCAPASGRILLDGIDLGLLDPVWLRRQTGVVLQESVLFNRSVRDNIALAVPATQMNRIIAVAQVTGAHDFIMKLPQGYDTLVGERGCRLSAGQRQRIATARALLSDPRILIFDEATDALDDGSDGLTQEDMAEIAKGRTVLILAHGPGAARRADRILTIERGRLVERENHLPASTARKAVYS